MLVTSQPFKFKASKSFVPPWLVEETNSTNYGTAKVILFTVWETKGNRKKAILIGPNALTRPRTSDVLYDNSNPWHYWLDSCWFFHVFPNRQPLRKNVITVRLDPNQAEKNFTIVGGEIPEDGKQ